MKVVEKKKAFVPELRFKEFEDNWTKKKFRDLFSIGSGKDFKHLKEGNIPVFGTGGKMASVSEYLYDGETVFIGRKGTIDKPFYFKGPFWTVDTLFYTHKFIEACPRFVNALFQNVNWYKHNEASGVPSLSKKTIESLPCKIPTLPEQQKIAAFLSAVDEKIQQLTQKKALLEQYKKGVMQKLFPKKAGQAPELRFKKPDGSNYPDWEEKKLGEVCELVGGGTPESSNESYWNGNINWATPSEIKTKYFKQSQRKITDLGLKKSSAKLLPIGTILFCSRATIGEMSITQSETSTNQGFQSFLPNDNYVTEFLFQWLTISKHRFIRRASGSTFLEISKKEIGKVKINIPSKEEQQKIADFLSGIDQKIKQVATQIHQTQTFKKGLLQQMFV